MCAWVETRDRRILIDPGISLGLVRHGLLPHPCQIAHGAQLRERIVRAFMQATDVILSHYHGDHIPLAVPNPYQLPLERVAEGLKGIRLWGMSPRNTGAAIYNRAKDLEEAAGVSILPAEGHKDAQLQISEAMPHGLYGHSPNMVVMSRIEEDGFVFVHASDIQLVERNPVQQIIDWAPDVVFLSGPPLYIETLSADVRAEAWENALTLAESVATVIIDHHLLRCREGVEWLEMVARVSGNHVVCAADYQKKTRRFLEADRERFYKMQPVSEGWHEAYEDSWKRTNMYG